MLKSSYLRIVPLVIGVKTELLLFYSYVFEEGCQVRAHLNLQHAIR